MRSELYYQAGETIYSVIVERDEGHFRVTIGDRVYEVGLSATGSGWLDLEIDGRRLRSYVAPEGSSRHVAVAGQTWVLERVKAGRSGRRKAGLGEAALGTGALAAEMPGQVLDVLVAPGDSVAAGQTLVLLEAMKMELRVTAPAGGRVRQVHCEVGQVVERGQVLVELEAEADHRS